MKLNLKFETIEDVKNFQSNVQSIKLQILEFQAFTVRKLGEQIVDRIHEKMRESGFSEKIINGTKLDNIEIISTKRVRLYFRSEYFANNGFDVALGREEGTDKHKVEAGPGTALPIPTEGGIIFRKSAEPDGIVALYIVRDTVKQMVPHLQDEYNRQFTQWLAENFGGQIIAS